MLFYVLKVFAHKTQMVEFVLVMDQGRVVDPKNRV